MERQNRARLPVTIVLAALAILVAIAAGSGGAVPERESYGGDDNRERSGDLAREGAGAFLAAPEETWTASRAIFLLALLLVTGAATADVFSAELARRRVPAERSLHARIHAQPHERTMS